MGVSRSNDSFYLCCSTLGKIDCANGLDEQRCDELEMNECDNATEFRCRNGLCIDNAFYFDGEDDCMDLSDEIGYIFGRLFCTSVSMPTCEDRICPPTWFSCGSGQCYDGFQMGTRQECETHRDRLYFEKMPPSIFTFFTHVSLIYNDTQTEWICYNQTLCPHLSLLDHTESMGQFDNTTVCRKFTAFPNQIYESFDKMVTAFKNFVRSCSLPTIFKSNKECPMFSCNDNRKCISYHRLSDGVNDCHDGEDERQNYTCSFGLSHRHVCDNGTLCIPLHMLHDSKVRILLFFMKLKIPLVYIEF